MTTPLMDRHCARLAKGGPHLTRTDARRLLEEIHPDWSLAANAKSITREFRFKDYRETIAFVNAVAEIANTEDHHPDMEVSYNRCTVHYSTHSVGGLSENDFICAAKIDRLPPSAS